MATSSQNGFFQTLRPRKAKYRAPYTIKIVLGSWSTLTTINLKGAIGVKERPGTFANV